MKMKLSIAIIAILAALSTMASADEYYWGLAAGQSYNNLCPSQNKFEYSCPTTGVAAVISGGYNFNPFLVHIGGKVNDAGVISGGYNFFPYFGIEANYEVLGNQAAYQLSTGPDGAANASIKSSAIAVAAIGNLEVIKNISLIGKLGINGIMISQQSQTALNTASNTNLNYGFGLKYDFTKTVAGRALWENLGWAGNDSITPSRMSLISAGLVFKY